MKKVQAKSLAEYLLAIMNKQEVEPTEEFVEEFTTSYLKGRDLCAKALGSLPRNSYSEQELVATAYGMIHFAGDFIKNGTKSNEEMMRMLSEAAANIINIAQEKAKKEKQQQVPEAAAEKESKI